MDSVTCADYRSMDIPEDAVIITDPPYGIGFDYGGEYHDSALDYDDLILPIKGRQVALLQYPEEMISKIAPCLGPPDKVLAWVYPSNIRRQFRLWGLWGLKPDYSQVKQPAKNPEAAKVKSAMVDSYDWWQQPQVKNVSAEKTDHPCQIPISSVERILALVRPGLVFDPFTGSGTTGIACARMGIPFSGAEIDPRFCAIANERINQAKGQQRLFTETA